MPKYLPGRPLNLYAMDRVCRIKVLMCAPATRRRNVYAIQAPPHLELDAVLEAVKELFFLEGVECTVVAKKKRRATVHVAWRRPPEKDFAFKDLEVSDDNLEAFLAELDS